ncbi:MAG TPA: transposase, partial [Tepidisphaeraceae bacterium]
MFPKQSKHRVKSSRRAGGFERSEKPAARRPARDRSCPGLRQTATKRDPRRPCGSQSEQSLGPSHAVPATRRRVAGEAKRASPHSQDRNPSMRESSSPQSSATPPPRPQAFVGIDLAKTSFQAAAEAEVPAARFNAAFAYDVAGIALLLERLKTLDVPLIVMEATGGLERELAAELAEAGYAVAVINPRQA